MSRIAAILPAAGMGTRMGAETPKQFLELDGTPIVILSLRRIAACPLVTDIFVATLPDDVALIIGTVPRERVVLAQTPQAFSAKLLKEAFARAEADGVSASDEAGLVERIGHDVHVVLGSERNMKITNPADMDLARFYLARERQKA